MQILTAQNLFLTRLPGYIKQTIVEASDIVHMDLREKIYEANQPIQFVDFPIDSVMSVVRPCDDGSEVEVANIGCEGMVGVAVTLGVEKVSERAFCQVEGSSHRIKTEVFLSLFEKHVEIQKLCQRYTSTIIDQMACNTGCNQTHSVEQRCARWLLMTHDRVQKDQFVLTQEFLSIMLGVSRTNVNAAAGVLSAANLISYTRGNLKILDRLGLEQASCSCHKALNDYFTIVMQN